MILNINVLNIITWFAFGLIVGVAVDLLDDSEVEGGIMATSITGVLGALIGGFLSYNLFGVGITGFNLTSFIIAIAGALVLSIVERVMFRKDIPGPFLPYGLKGGRSKHKKDTFKTL